MVREPGIRGIPAEMKRSSENPCGLCRNLDFDSLGLKPGDFPLLHGAYTSDLRPKILEIKSRAGTCVICSEVFEFYAQWINQNKALLDRYHDKKDDAAHFFIDKLGLGSYYPQNPKLVRMFVHVFIRNSRVPSSTPGHYLDGYYRLLLQFQKWIPERLVEGNGKRAVEQPYNGRKRGVLVNQTQLLDWKKVCDKNHGNSCKSDMNIMNHLDFIRLVDVQQRCVTAKKGGELANLEYAALSYVWGGKDALGGLKMPKLMYRGENCEEALRQPGALKREKVLRTIDDAMTFVDGGLKLKYLWVDCLCILQAGDDNISDNDTKADQKMFIDAMDSIYACASVTIVAAAGDNANAGLPGINRHFVGERMEQNPLQIQKRDKSTMSLVRTLDLEGSGEASYSQYRYVGGSTWDTRGWTFQEKIFSRRTFIFTNMQVYWECQAATWYEDSIWETTEPFFYRHCFNADEFRLPWINMDKGKFEGKYGKLVEEYTRRKLTQESDGLDAFTGILNVLGRGTGDLKQEFKWGLPLSLLANALQWGSHRDQPVEIALKSRTEKHRRCPFPSWSWVGWVGMVEMRSALNADTVDLQFYFLDDSAKILVKVECVTRCNDFWIVHIKNRGDRVDVHINDIEVQRALPRSVASNILFFWSSAARFRIRGAPSQGPLFCSREIATDKHIEVLVWNSLQRPLIPPKSTQAEYEFVVIGRHKPGYGEMNVLVCCENENEGVVYRKGLVQMDIIDWRRCEPEWKLICLG